MNQQWQRVPFADLLVDSRDGEWGEGVSAVGLQACDLIRGTDFSSLTDPEVSLPLRWIPDRLVERKQLQAGDIVFEMAGGTAKQSTGRSAFVAQSFLKSRQRPVLCASFCRHLRLDRERFEPRFVYYLLQALYAAGYMGVFNIQHTGVSRFQYTSFKKHTELRIPRLSTQKKIAAALAAYDDLIENNRRRIALLERMAEQLYREWFVRFRFPGYRQAKFEKGVPNGWHIEPSSKLVEVMSGGTPKTDVPAYWDGGIPFFTPKDAAEDFYVLDTEKKVSPAGLEACNSKLYPKDTIFITARGTVGKLVLAHRDMVMNQSCYALAPKNADVPFFHFLALKTAVSTIKGVSNSGVFDNIVVDTFKVVPIRVPPDDLIQSFNKLMAPIFEQIGSLLLANVVLARTRDLLLPRLISGKLRVDDLDIQFPPSIQAQA